MRLVTISRTLGVRCIPRMARGWPPFTNPRRTASIWVAVSPSTNVVFSPAHVSSHLYGAMARLSGPTSRGLAGPPPGGGCLFITFPFPPLGGNARDLAILHLSDPLPVGVSPAPLRSPKPADLVDRRWWAFGFPYRDPVVSSVVGQIGASPEQGLIRLDNDSGLPIGQGFIGGGLWSPDYNAVVAVIVGERRGGNAVQAITLHQAGSWFPGETIRRLAERWSPAEAGDVALAAWGWSLSDDLEGPRHWRPRARGVGIDSERGHRFCGRTAALREIVSWLDRKEPDRRVLVVTGAPGAGKSAVLGRIVTTADAEVASQLPASDTGVRATAGSVACAVHAKGKTALEVATEIARAASVGIPERTEDFGSGLREVL